MKEKRAVASTQRTASRKYQPHARVRGLNDALASAYGPQGWWPTTAHPGEKPVYRPGREGHATTDAEAFEIMVGSILTQNTAWTNAEMAIMNLTRRGLMSPEAILAAGDDLNPIIRSAGYYNQKASRLRLLSRRVIDGGGIAHYRGQPTTDLRETLLSFTGVGPETADSILCYAFSRPVFVVDAYTKRLFTALGLPAGSYGEMQELVHESLAANAGELGDFHARIVRLLKEKEKARQDFLAGAFPVRNG